MIKPKCVTQYISEGDIHMVNLQPYKPAKNKVLVKKNKV